MKRSPIRRRSRSRGSEPRKPMKKTPLKKVNPERQAKRQKRFKAYLGSADWKAKRQEVFARDDYRCTATVLVPEWSDPYCVVHDPTPMRCPFMDETRTGKGLVCNHKTYARFGDENLDDLETLCRSCDRKETAKHRANHFNGFNNGERRGTA